MHDRALNHTLEAQRGLRVDFTGAWHRRCIVANKIGQGFAEVIDVDRASP